MAWRFDWRAQARGDWGQGGLARGGCAAGLRVWRGLLLNKGVALKAKGVKIVTLK